MELSIAGAGFIINGAFPIIRRRRLLHWLRGCDARLYHRFDQASADVSYLITDDSSDAQLSHAAERGVPILREDDLLEPLRIKWSVDARLVVLRGLLNLAPSDAVWRLVCQELELWPADQGLDIGLSYVEGATRDWPEDSLLCCPVRWLKRVAAHHPEPRMAIVRDLFIQRFGIQGRAVAPLMELLPPLRSIHITRADTDPKTPEVSIDARSLKAMLEHPNAASIHHLVLDRATLGEGSAEVVREAKLERLRQLSMVGTGYERSELKGVGRWVRVTI
jgi:hypothetical protein